MRLACRSNGRFGAPRQFLCRWNGEVERIAGEVSHRLLRGGTVENNGKILRPQMLVKKSQRVITAAIRFEKA
jgi:hypothetical protein